MKNIRVLFIYFAFAKANTLNAQQLQLRDGKFPEQLPFTSVTDYEASPQVRQIEIATYYKTRDSVVEPTKYVAYVFNDQGKLIKEIEQNKYYASGYQYVYNGKQLINKNYFNTGGITDSPLIYDSNGRLSTYQAIQYNYTDGKLSRLKNTTTFETTATFTHRGDLTIAKGTKDMFYYVMKGNEVLFYYTDSNSIYAYNYPFDGVLAYKAGDKKSPKTVDDLIALFQKDVKAYNAFVKANIASGRVDNPYMVIDRNDKGDWIRAIKEPKFGLTSQSYYFRKVTYQDGSTSGSLEFDAAFVKNHTGL